LTQQQIERLLKLLPGANPSKSSFGRSLGNYGTDEELDYNFSGIVYCSCAVNVSNDWILDTGAIYHMTPNASRLTACHNTKPDSHINLQMEAQLILLLNEMSGYPMGLS